MAQRNTDEKDTGKRLSRKRKAQSLFNDPPLVDSRSVPSRIRLPQMEEDTDGSSSSSEDDDIPLTELYRAESGSSYYPSDEDVEDNEDEYMERKQVPVNTVLPLNDDVVWGYLVGTYQTVYEEVRNRLSDERNGSRTTQTMVGVGILDAYDALWQLKTRTGNNFFPRLYFRQKNEYHRNLLTKGEICRKWLTAFYELATRATTIPSLRKARLAGRLQGYWWFLSQMANRAAREEEIPVTTHLRLTTQWRLFYSTFRERALDYLPKTVPRMRQMFRDIFLKPVYIAMSRLHLRRAVPPTGTQLMKFKVAMDVLFCVLPADKEARR